MQDNSTPKKFPEWSLNSLQRTEDAAYTFGHHLIIHSRNTAIEALPVDLTDVQREKSIEAIDISLHNMMDLLEGFWKLESGSDHTIEYALQVVVKNNVQKEVERIEISPAKLDLPIGYWKWAKNNEFR